MCYLFFQESHSLKGNPTHKVFFGKVFDVRHSLDSQNRYTFDQMYQSAHACDVSTQDPPTLLYMNELMNQL